MSRLPFWQLAALSRYALFLVSTNNSCERSANTRSGRVSLLVEAILAHFMIRSLPLCVFSSLLFLAQTAILGRLTLPLFLSFSSCISWLM